MRHFEQVRPVTLTIIVAFFGLHIIFNALNNFVLFPSGVYLPLGDATSGLINGTLQANALMIVVLIGGVLMWWGKLRPFDLGLILSGLPRAALLTLIIWGITQGVLALIALANGQPLSLDSIWTNSSVTWVIGSIIGQILGNALFEEVGYRSFMFPQLYRKLNISRFGLKMIAALLASQFLFALIHLPTWIANGQDILATVPRVMALGMFFALFYIVTDNIFLSIGVHALGNRPTPLFASELDSSMLILLVSLLVLTAIWVRQRTLASQRAQVQAAA